MCTLCTYTIHTYIHICLYISYTIHTCIDELHLSKCTEAGEGGTGAPNDRNWPVPKFDESPAQALLGPCPAPSAIPWPTFSPESLKLHCIPAHRVQKNQDTEHVNERAIIS